MYYNQSGALHGASHKKHRHQFWQSHQRAAVNVYKTENSYELLVFAPGRVKENFSVKAQGNELTVSYQPQEGLQRPDWRRIEYSRGGFERTLTIDESIDATNVKAIYTDGVLQVSLPIIPGKEIPEQKIEVN
ncbi:MAG: Hsp20/alpha crystallin family protein [Ginsengibacter sp.]